MGEFCMPSLGADMDEGTIVEWKVRPGDTVHRGDIVAVVDTDKSDIEVEVFEDGVVEALLVETGVKVPVGTVLARIALAAPPEGPHEPPPSVAQPAAKRHRKPARRARPAFTRASPLARRRAAAAGVDLTTAAGSGPNGAVVARDIGQTTPVVEPTASRTAPPDRQANMRRAIGALMSRSKREIPHYYLATTIDLDASLNWLAKANADRPVSERLLPAALLLKATALSAVEVPVMNGLFDEQFHPSLTVDLGVAVSLRAGGLIAPAIHDAATCSVEDLMVALRNLVARARQGSLRSSEMIQPTITVTNLGDQGVEEVFGVIYPPQVALVGFGRIAPRPWAVDGLLGVRPVVRATLAADHRASDGHDGARFLAAIDRLLQHPEDL